MPKDSAHLRAYRAALYATQFVASGESLDALSQSLPRLLTALRVTDEETRIRVIETVRNAINDIQFLHLTLSKSTQLLARTTRIFIRHFLLLFGLLATGASYAKILKLWRTPLKTAMVSGDLRNPAKYAASVSLLLSTLPLIRSRIANDVAASLVHSSLALSLFPEGYSKDYAVVYALAQALEHRLKNVADSCKYKMDLYWLLVPISLSEILHLLTSTPQYLPATITRLITGLYSGLIESKPKHYAKDWPQTLDVFLSLRETKRVDKGLLRADIVSLIRVNPGHTNAKMSMLSPSEPSLKKVLLKKSPRKLLALLSVSFPLLVLVNYLRLKLSSESNAKPDWSNLCKKSLKSSLKFSLTSLMTLITSYTLLTTRLSPRCNGFVSGLWFYVYKDTFNTYLFSYLARITFLATFRQHRDRLLRHGGVLGSIVGSYASTAIGCFSILQLLQLDADGKLRGRFQKCIQFIKNGGSTSSL